MVTNKSSAEKGLGPVTEAGASGVAGAAGAVGSAAKKGWVGQLDSDQFSLKESVGGARGVIESLAPALVFIVAYVMTHELAWPLILSSGLAIIFLVARLVQRQPLTQALAGVFGVAIGVIWAAASGKAENYFAWGLVTNGFFFLVFLVSMLIRKPAVSVIVTLFQSLEAGQQPPLEGLAAKRANTATWLWAGVFGLRLALQLPLYLTGNVVWLGVVKLVGGLPLFAFAGWLTWVLLRGVLPKPLPQEQKVAQDE